MGVMNKEPVNYKLPSNDDFKLYGRHNALYLLGKSSVQAVGANEFGQLADGTFTGRTEIKPIEMAYWLQFDSYSHMLAITTDNKLYGWVCESL